MNTPLSYEDKYKHVAEFQVVAQVKTSAATQKLYIDLFHEEHKEFHDAIHDFFASKKQTDLVEVFDGLADMMVIQMGCQYHKMHSAIYLQTIIVQAVSYTAATVVQVLPHAKFNMVDLTNEVFLEVAASNMSKFCTTEEDAIKSVENYTFKGIETYFELNDGFYSIKSSKTQTVADVDGKETTYPAHVLKAFKSFLYF